MLRIDRYGRQLPVRKFAHRALGAAAFASDGSIYFGETLTGKTPYRGSHMEFVPGTDCIGYGRILKFDRKFELV